MLIQDWMAKDVVTVDENTSLMRATRIMKENVIRRLPVVSHGKLIGIVTDRDVKDASPSKTTSLDVHELYYILSEMKVKEVMTHNPATLNGFDSLEKAAVIMLEKKISGLPVVNSEGQIVGLVSETDVLRGFIHSTGIKDGAIQYVLDLKDVPGSVTSVVQTMRDYHARVISVLTSFEDAGEGMKRVAIRVIAEEGCDCEDLTAELKKKFIMVYHGMDELKE
ncbi:MAG: CBS and ACT domain-containing protein [Proteobacteria bacterium]|jgi:acetoin utilization protein AcuB|nr:CBS and ACT domain-containing protein [Pseudomonadota bacterium]MBU1639555.1 CBS and ACT domain-containing protein [Pseudomonadota bacterium]